MHVLLLIKWLLCHDYAASTTTVEISNRPLNVWEVRANLCVFNYRNNYKVRRNSNATQAYSLFIEKCWRHVNLTVGRDSVLDFYFNCDMIIKIIANIYAKSTLTVQRNEKKKPKSWIQISHRFFLAFYLIHDGII